MLYDYVVPAPGKHLCLQIAIEEFRTHQELWSDEEESSALTRGRKRKSTHLGVCENYT